MPTLHPFRFLGLIAYSVGVVASSVAAEPARFADEIVRLYRDPALWLKLSDAGLANIQAHFSFAAARSALERILRR